MTTGQRPPRAFRRDSDQEHARDRAARGALRVLGLDSGPVHGAAQRLRQHRERFADDHSYGSAASGANDT